MSESFERAALKYARRCCQVAETLVSVVSSLGAEGDKVLVDWKGPFADDFTVKLNQDRDGIVSVQSMLRLEADSYAAASAESYNERKQVEADEEGGYFQPVPVPSEPLFAHPEGE